LWCLSLLESDVLLCPSQYDPLDALLFFWLLPSSFFSSHGFFLC
jgi:hypothetical protein